MARIADYEFNGAPGDRPVLDTLGAHHGRAVGDTALDGSGSAFFDGEGDFAAIRPDPAFVLNQGSVIIEFEQETASAGDHPWGKTPAQTLFSVDALGTDIAGQLTIYIRSDGKIDGADPSIAALSGEIVVRFADTTLLTQAVDGTPCELEFDYEIDSDTKFTLTAHSVYLPTPRLPISGPGGMQVTFAWQAALDTSEGVMCTATLINDMANFNNPT